MSTFLRSFETYAADISPAYVIQPRTEVDELRDGVKILLGSNLATTLFHLSIRNASKGNARKTRIKSDSPAGVKIHNAPSFDRHDTFTNLGGDYCFNETVAETNKLFSVTLSLTTTDNFLQFSRLQAKKPTLVLSRSYLCHHHIAPQLRGVDWNPYYSRTARFETLPHTFGQLVDLVREHVRAGAFLLTD